MIDSTASKWVRVPRPDPQATIRLFCLPWAGGGSSAFNSWGRELSPGIEVCAVQLPGREDRLREPPRTSLMAVAEELSAILEPSLNLPYALFGHSLGAVLAFEMARRLRTNGAPQPVRLFVSGSEAPDFSPRDGRRHTLSDSALLEEVGLLSGTADAVLAEPDLMALFLPALRADLKMAETYRCVQERPLDAPITAFAGNSDAEVRFEGAEAWAQHTTRTFTLHAIDGGHFFVQSARSELLRILRHDLTPQ